MTERRAYAKINLGLRIIRRRPDGYHEIETVFHRIDLFDEISFEPSDSISLTSSDPAIPTDDRNLCIKAAIALGQATGTRRGVSMKLRKRIPVGAGLGGGSSDAASTLLALKGLWGLATAEEELFRIALQIGADVPYFLKGGTAAATGRGEQLEYFPLELPYWILIVYPGIQVPTAWAYQNTDIDRLTRRPPFTIPLRQIISEGAGDLRRLTLHLGNDFEPLVLGAHTAIAQLKAALPAFGAELVLLSGSGSSVFALFRSERQARAAETQLGKSYSVFLTGPNFRPPE